MFSKIHVGGLICRTLEHFHGSFGELDEDAIIDLQQPEQLQSFALLRIDLVDALNADDECQLRICWDVKALAFLCLALKTYPLALGVAVLLHIFLGPCEDDLALLLALV